MRTEEEKTGKNIHPAISPGLSEKKWMILVLSISIVILIFTGYSLYIGITSVFMHLYYIPIILVSYHYQKKGVIFSGILGALYVLMVIYFTYPDTSQIILAFERLIFFIIIAAVVAFLSYRLTRTKEFFETLTEISPVGIIQTDKDGMCLYVNRKFTEITGVPSEIALLEGWKDAIHPGDRERFSIEWLACADDNCSHSLEYRILRSDGNIVWVNSQVYAEKNPDGEVTGYIGTITDITKNKERRERLQRTQFAFDHSPDEIYFVNSEALIIYANISARNSLGINPDNNDKGDTVFKINPEMNQERWKEIWNETIKEEFLKFESFHRRPDGTTYPVEISKFHINFGGVDYSCTIARDITERKRSEEVIVRNEKRYRSTLNNMLEGCQIIDPDWRYQFLNKAAIKQSHKSPDELIGKTVMEAYPGIEDTEAFKNLKRCMDERITIHFETEFEYPDSSLGWFNISVEPVPEGIFLLSQDITERKVAESALLKSEEKYRILVQLAGEGIWTVNTEGITTFVNPAMARILGCAPEDIEGKLVFEFMDEGGVETSKKLIESLKKGIPEACDLEFVRKDGGRIYTRISTSPLYNDEGQNIGGMALVSDITERHLAEKSLNEVNKKLNLLSSITRHDILNQITGAAGYLELLDMDEEIPAGTKTDEYIGKISTAVENIKKQILFTGYYKDLGEKVPQWFKIDELITEVYLNPAFKSLALHNEVKNFELFADPLFEKVIYNLFDNAVKHAENATYIKFSVTETEEETLLICEDNGSGVPDEAKEKIFKREYYKNSGLGLFLSREILAITDLTIRETGVYGKGARFEIHIPKNMSRHTDLS